MKGLPQRSLGAGPSRPTVADWTPSGVSIRSTPLPRSRPYQLVPSALVVALKAELGPRTNSRSSTFRSDNGNRTYISTTGRITSDDEWKERNGWQACAGEACASLPRLPDSAFGLTMPEPLPLAAVPRLQPPGLRPDVASKM